MVQGCLLVFKDLDYLKQHFNHLSIIQKKGYKVNYQPVIHCGGISQSAKICEIDKEYLRTGDKARIRFQFMNRPEHLETGTKLMFREGETKGVGKIVEVH